MITNRKEVTDAPDTSEMGGCDGGMTAVVLGTLFIMVVVTTSLAFRSNVQTTLEKG